MRVVQQNGSFFNPLACRREMSGTFLAYWRVFFILIVSLHSKAGLAGALNQYWESKALVLGVYRSMPSAGLCFICTFWSRCAGGGTGELQWRQPFVPRRGTRLAHPETPPPRFSLWCGSWGSPFWASSDAPLSITCRFCSSHQDVELWPSEPECNVNYSVGWQETLDSTPIPL